MTLSGLHRCQSIVHIIALLAIDGNLHYDENNVSSVVPTSAYMDAQTVWYFQWKVLSHVILGAAVEFA